MHFADTNIVVYAFGTDAKSETALSALDGAIVSVQVLNEFSNVCLRKLHYDEATLGGLIADIRDKVTKVVALTEDTHDLARKIVFRYKHNFYDSVLIASALLAECVTLYSEDMQHGLIIEDRLTIINPFV